MIRNFLKINLVFISILCPIYSVSAVGSLNIIINEIAWIGTKNSANDEWIELYNNTDNAINLEGWVLKSADGTPEINLSGIIPAKGFYLLERTDDETVPGISANLIYTGALGNNGEHLKLYDDLGNLIDEVDCSDSWFAGDNKTKQTMERGVRPGSDPNIWQTSAEPGGTPKDSNSIQEAESIEPTEPIPEPEPTTEPEPPKLITEAEEKELINYPSGIIFNEILPSPEGPDAENEWIEIFNQNDFEIDLSGWTIKDILGKSNTYTLNTKIPAFEYLILLRPETKITLNNDGDGLNLFNPNGEVVDSVNFGKASLDQSYSKTSSGWTWNSNLTPGSKNIIPISKTTETKQEIQKNKSAEDGPRQTADISKTITKLAGSSKPSVLLIAFIIAIFSAIALLVVKTSLS